MFIVCIGIYFAFDFRPLEDRLSIYLEEKNYKDILKIAGKKDFQSQSILSIASLALTRYETEINSQCHGDSKGLIEFGENLKKLGLNSKIVQRGQLPYLKIEDIYYRKLKNNTYYQTKVILEKFKYSIGTNTEEENINSFLILLGRDPRPFIPEFSELVIEFLKRHTLSGFSENDGSNFLNLLYYLANRVESDIKSRFALNIGDEINVRTGPGLEHSIIDKISKEEVLLRLEVDPAQHKISNDLGNWVYVYIFSKDTKAWIFSPFLKNVNPDPTYGTNYTFKPYDG